MVFLSLKCPNRRNVLFRSSSANNSDGARALLWLLPVVISVTVCSVNFRDLTVYSIEFIYDLHPLTFVTFLDGR